MTLTQENTNQFRLDNIEEELKFVFFVIILPLVELHVRIVAPIDWRLV
jgi:hypothetical protein